MTKLLQTTISFEETRVKKDQKQTMNVEYDAMMKNQTWELVSCPK